jgi:transketolase
MELAEPLRTQAANTLRFLAVDAIEKANSGHPGMPLGCADLALEIWTRHLRYAPTDPEWADRDRFVLSAGHGSMLLYGLLHLAGFALTIDDLKHFRQLDSKTPGHPELHFAPGVETTTGPLGQGIANSVGMSIASHMLKARFPGVFNQRTFVICGDGDLQEGISHEACALAGHLGLDGLVLVYDDNHITLDGPATWSQSEDTKKRFEAYGWFVQAIDGHDPVQIRAALDAAVAEQGRPSIICARTHIGFGSPNKHDSAKAHGSPLGKEEAALTKQALGWPLEPTFLVPDEVRAAFARRAAELEGERKAFDERVAQLSLEQRATWESMRTRHVPSTLVGELFAAAQELATKAGAKGEATRVLSSRLEQVAAKALPWLQSGSADLQSSCHTHIDGAAVVSRGEFGGRNVNYGIREHAMGSIANGIAVHGGFSPITSTFHVFSDYMRPAIRLAAIMEQQVFFVFTHDSVFLGEDGPTHQAVEQTGALRLIPNLRVVRPADPMECAAAWAYAIERRDGPTCFVLTRQKVPTLERPAGFDPQSIVRGAYRLVDAVDPTITLIATGSEVQLAVEAAKVLASEGERPRVVSAPCLEALEDLGDEALDEVIPEDGSPRVAIEAGRTTPWRGLVGRHGLVIGIDTFGASAPDKDLAVRFGLTRDAVLERVRPWLKGLRAKRG